MQTSGSHILLFNAGVYTYVHVWGGGWHSAKQHLRAAHNILRVQVVLHSESKPNQSCDLPTLNSFCPMSQSYCTPLHCTTNPQ